MNKLTRENTPKNTLLQEGDIIHYVGVGYTHTVNGDLIGTPAFTERENGLPGQRDYIERPDPIENPMSDQYFTLRADEDVLRGDIACWQSGKTTEIIIMLYKTVADWKRAYPAIVSIERAVPVAFGTFHETSPGFWAVCIPEPKTQKTVIEHCSREHLAEAVERAARRIAKDDLSETWNDPNKAPNFP